MIPGPHGGGNGRTACLRVVAEFFVEDRAQCGDADGAGERRAAVSRAVRAGAEHLAQIAAIVDPKGAEREAAADRLGPTDAVGLNLIARDDAAPSGHFTGAAETDLHFVQKQQQVLFTAQTLRRPQELGRGRIHAAFSLNGLHEDGDGFVRDRGFERGDVVKGGIDETGGQRAETAVDLLLRRSGHGSERAAVEGAGEGDDLVAPAGLLAVFAGEFEQTFVRLRAAVAEEAFAGDLHALLDENARQFGLLVDAVPVRDMNQRVRLLGHRFHDGGRAVAERAHGHAAGEVEILLPVAVPDIRAFATHGPHVVTAVVGQDVLAEPVGFRMVVHGKRGGANSSNALS